MTLKTSKIIKPLLFLICLVGLCLLIFSKINSKENKDKSNRLEYYYKNEISLIGKIYSIKYLSRGCLIYVDIIEANTQNFNGFEFGDGTRDIVINNNRAILISDNRELIMKGDSVVVVFNRGVYKIYRNDSLIVDQGFQYFKNGKVTD